MHAEGHANVVRHAVRILANDGLTNYGEFANEVVGLLTEGALHADTVGDDVFLEVDFKFLLCVEVEVQKIPLKFKTGTLQHYYDPVTKRGLDLSQWGSLNEHANSILDGVFGNVGFGTVHPTPQISIEPALNFSQPYLSAADLCQIQYDNAVKAWRERLSESGRGYRGTAMFHLGWACHLVADLAISPHTTSDEFWFHGKYEDFAQPGRYPEEDEYHANSISRNLADYKLEESAWQMAADCAAETRPELGLYRSDRHAEGMRLAVPRAEQYTARLLAKFFSEVGIPTEALPLHVSLVDDQGHSIRDGYLFYRSPTLNWELAEPDIQGNFQLTLAEGESCELRPAKPGYLFEGEYYGDGPSIPEFPTPDSPVHYMHKSRPFFPPKMYLRLRKTFQLGSVTTVDDVETPEWERLAAKAISEQIHVLTMGNAWGELPFLQIGDMQHVVYVGIHLCYLVNWETGDLIRSFGELSEIFHLGYVKRRPIQRAERASASVVEAIRRLPKSQITPRRPGGIRTFWKYRQAPATAKEPPIQRLAREGLFTLPVPAGCILRARVEAEGGLVGAYTDDAGTPSSAEFLFARRVEIQTGADGWAWFRVKPGNQAGKLRLFIGAINIPETLPNMWPAKAIDLLVMPDERGGPDVGPARPPVLEKIGVGETNWPGAA